MTLVQPSKRSQACSMTGKDWRPGVSLILPADCLSLCSTMPRAVLAYHGTTRLNGGTNDTKRDGPRPPMPVGAVVAFVTGV